MMLVGVSANALQVSRLILDAGRQDEMSVDEGDSKLVWRDALA